MKKSVFSIFGMASLLVAGMAMVSCNQSEEKQNIEEAAEQTPVSKTYFVTVKTSAGASETATRALALSDDESSIEATWEAGEEVTVYNSTKGASLTGTLVAESDGVETILKGALEGVIEVDDELLLEFLSEDFENQDGTLTGSSTSIDEVCDYATAIVTVSEIKGDDVSGYSVTTSDADFVNQVAIAKFTLLDGNGDAIDPTSVTVVAGSLSLTFAEKEFYAALPVYTGSIAITATVGSDSYSFTTPADVSFEAGNYYPIYVKLRMQIGVTDFPAATTPTYNGTAQALITAGAANGGTFKYFVSDNSTEPAADADGWTETVPEGTNAGTYYVWYQVEGSELYYSIGVTEVESCSIAQRPVTVNGIKALDMAFKGVSTKVNLDYSSVDFGDATANADVNLEVTATGNFADWDIEDDKTVTISGITLGGTNVDNYILAADGNQTSSVASIKPFLYVTADSIGYYVCSDRSYFSPSTAVPTGKTVVGMIAYVNDGITSGYIISKSDINPVKHANISFSSYTAITGLDAWATPSDEIWENMWSHVNGVAASTGMDALTDSYWSSNEENNGKGHYWTVGDSGNPKKAQTKNSTYKARAYTSFVIPSATIR